MAKKEAIEVEGKITESLPNATFTVELANGHSVLAYISGKLRTNYIRVLPGDRVLVDNNGLHAYTEASGAIKLKAGFYPLTASYFEADGDEQFSVSWEGPSIKKQKLPADALYTKKPVRKKTRAPVAPCQPTGN